MAISGRYAHVFVKSPGTVSYIEGSSYDEVQIGGSSVLVNFNSVMLIPGLVSPDDCEKLIADAEVEFERCHNGGCDSTTCQFVQWQTGRMCCDCTCKRRMAASPSWGCM